MEVFQARQTSSSLLLSSCSFRSNTRRMSKVLTGPHYVTIHFSWWGPTNTRDVRSCGVRHGLRNFCTSSWYHVTLQCQKWIGYCVHMNWRGYHNRATWFLTSVVFKDSAVQCIGLNGKFVPVFGQIKIQTCLCRYNFIHQCMHHFFLITFSHLSGNVVF
jgi:hypothetical protein